MFFPQPGVKTRLFLLEVGGVEQDEAREFAGGGGGQDFAAKTAPDEQRQAPAMVEMGVGQQNEVDLARRKAEILRIFLLDAPPALIEPAIDQDFAARRLQQMAGAGDAAIGAVEGKSHFAPLAAFSQARSES